MNLIVKTPVNRLTALIKTPGGITVRKALSSADANLLSIRDACCTALDEGVTQMRDIFTRSQDDPMGAAKEIYTIANTMVGTAGAMKMLELSQAAYSLCEALDKMMVSERWDARSVEVHIHALSRLRLVDGNQEISAAIVDGLRRVAARAG